MAIYNKTIWENEKTPLNAGNMQKIEDGLEYLFDLNKTVPNAEGLREQAETRREQQENTRQTKDAERTKTINDNISKINSAKISMETTLANKIVEVDTVVSTKITEANNTITDIERRFLELTASQQQSAEMVDARISKDGTKHASLKARIDEVETKPYVWFVEVEG